MDFVVKMILNWIGPIIFFTQIKESLIAKEKEK